MLARILMPWKLTRNAYVGRHRASVRWNGTESGFVYVDEIPDAGEQVESPA
ncbi:hypothetical protein STSO111631_11750 [Stackebrandtia soli]